MANIKVKDLSNISSVNTTDKMMVLTNENTNQVQNVTVQNLLTSAISSDANNVLEQGNDHKLYVETPESITGKLTNLTTTNKTNLVAAINEVDGDVGNLANLTTSVKTNVVNAINSVISDENTKVGSLENLTTSDKTSVVNAINSAVSDYDNKIGDLGDLDTTDKTDIVVAINELAAIAEPSLQYETMNNSKALETGAPSENAIILANIQKYAHSTFDSSKFTVVGTPNITDNGIVNGFSDSNYLSIPNAVVSKIDSGNAWKIDFKGVMTPTEDEASSITGKTADVDGRLNIGLLNGTQNFYLQFYDNTNTAHAIYIDSVNTSGNRGKPYIGYASYDGNDTYKLALSFDNGETWLSNTGTFTQKVYIGSYNLLIGYKYGGSIDLKQFSITVDGVPAFSGNKTGIDTVKANNFTDSGSLVNAEGIAVFPTTHDTSSIVLPEQFKPADKPWEIYIHCKTGDSWNTSPTLFTVTGSASNYGSVQFGIPTGHGKFSLNLNLDDQQTGFTDTLTTTFAPVLNTEYWLKLAFTGSDYQILVSSDRGKTYTLNAHLSSTTPFAQNQTAPSCIGIGRAASSAQQWGGFIDLNGFKIYVGGDLAYQPCLKIPYTEAHSGAKIVDSIYRDRVTDAYNQGYVEYNYYTLQSDVKSNFTIIGSPTIINGIASGFSGSNYLIASFNFNNKPLKFTFSAKVDGPGTNIIIQNSTLNGNNRIYIDSDGKLAVAADDGGGTYYSTTFFSNSASSFGTMYYYELSYDNISTWNVKRINLSDNSVTTDSKTFAHNFSTASNTWYIGAIDATHYLNGSIDLKQFSITVDGEVVYTPYIQPNFTLPMGDIYGMIENKFDTATTTSDERQAIIGYLMPDYANGISFSGNSSYTCPSYGVVICVGSTSSGYRRVLCNGEMVGSYSQAGDVTSSCYFPVKQGDVITNEQNTTFFGNAKFYPLKGV